MTKPQELLAAEQAQALRARVRIRSEVADVLLAARVAEQEFTYSINRAARRKRRKK